MNSVYIYIIHYIFPNLHHFLEKLQRKRKAIKAQLWAPVKSGFEGGTNEVKP